MESLIYVITYDDIDLSDHVKNQRNMQRKIVLYFVACNSYFISYIFTSKLFGGWRIWISNH